MKDTTELPREYHKIAGQENATGHDTPVEDAKKELPEELPPVEAPEVFKGENNLIWHHPESL